jgi:hypothetical protein
VPAEARKPEYTMQQQVTKDAQTIQGLQRVQIELHRQI